MFGCLPPIDDPKQITESGSLIYLVEGIGPDGKVAQYGMGKSQLRTIYDRGSNIRLAQWLGLVAQGLVLAEHIFQGLKRPLCDGDDMEADKRKLAISWRPGLDFWWTETDRFDSGKLAFRDAPDEKVFVVNASPNRRKDQFPSVGFWIERWYWVRESNTLKGAPVDWENRYDRKLEYERKHG